MIQKEGKDYYNCRELSTLSYQNSCKVEKLENLWRNTFSSHDNFKYITSSQFQVKLMPLARAKKLPHLECTKTSTTRVYFFFNIDDIIDCIANLTEKETAKYSSNFSNVTLVEAN